MHPIYTDRLVIRRFHACDGPALYEYLSDPEVVAFEPYPPLSEEEALREAERRAGGAAFYAVCLPGDKLIGNLYLGEGECGSRELGYVFHRGYWGQGYATESVRALLRHAFAQSDVRRVTAQCDPQNPASWRMLERIGMRREGTLLQNVYFRTVGDGAPIWKDIYLYAILREEF